MENHNKNTKSSRNGHRHSLAIARTLSINPLWFWSFPLKMPPSSGARPVHPASHALHKIAPPRNAPRWQGQPGPAAGRKIQRRNCWENLPEAMVLTCCIFLWAFLRHDDFIQICSKKTLFFLAGYGFQSDSPKLAKCWSSWCVFHWAYHLYTIPKWGVYKTNHWEYFMRIMGSVPYNMILCFLLAEMGQCAGIPKVMAILMGKLMINHELLGHPASFIHNPH